MIELAAIAAVFLAFRLVSQRLQKTVLTAPIFFVTASLVLGSPPLSVRPLATRCPASLGTGRLCAGRPSSSCRAPKSCQAREEHEPDSTLTHAALGTAGCRRAGLPRPEQSADRSPGQNSRRLA
jgi:hypothetical protein